MSESPPRNGLPAVMPIESHMRDLEMDLLEKGEASTSDVDRAWKIKELSRKIGRKVEWNFDGYGGVVFWIEKERDDQT